MSGRNPLFWLATVPEALEYLRQAVLDELAGSQLQRHSPLEHPTSNVEADETRAM